MTAQAPTLPGMVVEPRGGFPGAGVLVLFFFLDIRHWLRGFAGSMSPLCEVRRPRDVERLEGIARAVF